MTIILDMGGVLMEHNMKGCISRFRELLGEACVDEVLGLAGNAEGKAHSLMLQYERGEVSTDDFLDTLLRYAKPTATRDDLRQAWLLMHGGIPEERLEQIRRWKAAGHSLYLLSNNNDLHWTDIEQRYDLSMFSHCFVSHLLHCSKPEPEIYRITERYLNEHYCAKPFHFVDDLEANRKAAEAFGWQTYPDLSSLESVLRGR